MGWGRGRGRVGGGGGWSGRGEVGWGEGRMRESAVLELITLTVICICCFVLFFFQPLSHPPRLSTIRSCHWTCNKSTLKSSKWIATPLWAMASSSRCVLVCMCRRACAYSGTQYKALTT